MKLNDDLVADMEVYIYVNMTHNCQVVYTEMQC